jgi:hypothetical protein
MTPENKKLGKWDIFNEKCKNGKIYNEWKKPSVKSRNYKNYKNPKSPKKIQGF